MTIAADPETERYWPVAAAITLLLFVDGFDLFLLGKIAPAIADGFGRRPEDMQQVFTAHQMGLAVGAFLVPLFADRFGARLALVLCALFFGVGNLASAWAPDLAAFSWIRACCGVFIAGVVPVGLSLLSEKVPQAKIGTVLGVAMVGMTAGAAANGIAAAWLLDAYGWESGLIVGGILPLITIPLVLALVPESTRFFSRAARRSSAGIVAQLAGLFSDGKARLTLLLWLACSVTLGQNALVAVWLPTFFQELGEVPIQQFALVAMLSVVGGSIGTLAVGWLQDRFGPVLITSLVHLGNGASLFALALIPFYSVQFSLAFVVWSFFQSASISGINLLLVRFYGREIRATGSGWAAGMGRIAGMFAPAAGALALTANASLTVALAWSALPLIVVGSLIIPSLALVPKGRSDKSNQAMGAAGV